jgi:hypothetical protein
LLDCQGLLPPSTTLRHAERLAHARTAPGQGRVQRRPRNPRIPRSLRRDPGARATGATWTARSRFHELAAVSRCCAPPQAAQAERRTPDGGSESVSRVPSRDSKRPDRAGAPAEQRVAAQDARSPRKRSSGARRSPAVTRLRLRPDPSVCGLGSARLLLSSRRRGPGYRNGDQAQVGDVAVLAVGEQADPQKAAVGASSASTNIRHSRPLRNGRGRPLLLTGSSSRARPCFRSPTSMIDPAAIHLQRAVGGARVCLRRRGAGSGAPGPLLAAHSGLPEGAAQSSVVGAKRVPALSRSCTGDPSRRWRSRQLFVTGIGARSRSRRQ